jgi:hypothetical protein
MMLRRIAPATRGVATAKSGVPTAVGERRAD